MLRVANICEKNIFAVPALPVTAVANTAIDVLPDQTAAANLEVAARYIFNNSGSVAYYAIGQDCTITSYHGKIQDQQQLDCSNTMQRVSVLSVAGGVFAPTILRRNDLTQQPSVLMQQ